jgi:glucan 1,3-beta-glucosidase
MTMHVTSNVNGLYLEKVWLWTADRDIEYPNLTQITIYNSRGLHVKSDSGKIWL